MRKPQNPSLNQSIGYSHGLDTQTNDKTITIIRSHYWKNIREELLEEENDSTNHSNNEIAYIAAEINGVHTNLMIDTGPNVSLIDGTELNKIQKQYKKIPPALPINNIILLGATGRLNKTVRKQVMLELTSNGVTIPMIVLVANGLPFSILIGCDMSVSYTHLDVYKRQN